MGSQQGDRNQVEGRWGRQGIHLAGQMAARSPQKVEGQGTGGCGPHREAGQWDWTWPLKGWGKTPASGTCNRKQASSHEFLVTYSTLVPLQAVSLGHTCQSLPTGHHPTGPAPGFYALSQQPLSGKGLPFPAQLVPGHNEVGVRISQTLRATDENGPTGELPVLL